MGPHSCVAHGYDTSFQCTLIQALAGSAHAHIMISKTVYTRPPHVVDPKLPALSVYCKADLWQGPGPGR